MADSPAQEEPTDIGKDPGSYVPQRREPDETLVKEPPERDPQPPKPSR